MSKLTTINSILGALMLIMAFASARTIYRDVQKYGWVYDQTTIIGDEVTKTTVSLVSQVYASILFVILSIIYTHNNTVLRQSLTLEAKLVDTTNICFPLGDPESWDISVDLKTRMINVILDDKQVTFPLTMILEWVDSHENRKMEDMK